jgi:hypothetical protein
LQHDPDDPLPVESCYWGFWNRFAEDYMRLARLFGFIALLIALGLPQAAKAQNTGSGVVCDTSDQMRRFVLAENAPTALAMINAGQGQSCAVMNVSFYAGSIDGTAVTQDGVWQITHVLIVMAASSRYGRHRDGLLSLLRVTQLEASGVAWAANEPAPQWALSTSEGDARHSHVA